MGIPLIRWQSTQQSSGSGFIEKILLSRLYKIDRLVRPVKKLLDAPVIDEKTCRNAYPGLITSRMMCIGFMDGGKDSCAGDGGGPAVAHGPMVNETWHMNGAYWVANHEGGHQLSRMTHGELQGIVSWGHKCGEKNRPGVYTKVCQFNDWIHGVMNSN